jgi:hypothetical protein
MFASVSGGRRRSRQSKKKKKKKRERELRERRAEEAEEMQRKAATALAAQMAPTTSFLMRRCWEGVWVRDRLDGFVRQVDYFVNESASDEGAASGGVNLTAASFQAVLCVKTLVFRKGVEERAASAEEIALLESKHIGTVFASTLLTKSELDAAIARVEAAATFTFSLPGGESEDESKCEREGERGRVQERIGRVSERKRGE